MKLLLASNNAKKLKELQRILDQAGLDSVELLALRDVEAYDEPIEDGRTFADNAQIKARAGVTHTGIATIADDSGIAVEELNGMPGVLSARWSGAHGNDTANNELLLAQMEHVPTSAATQPSCPYACLHFRTAKNLFRKAVGKANSYADLRAKTVSDTIHCSFQQRKSMDKDAAPLNFPQRKRTLCPTEVKRCADWLRRSHR